MSCILHHTTTALAACFGSWATVCTCKTTVKLKQGWLMHCAYVGSQTEGLAGWGDGGGEDGVPLTRGHNSCCIRDAIIAMRHVHRCMATEGATNKHIGGRQEVQEVQQAGYVHNRRVHTHVQGKTHRLAAQHNCCAALPSVTTLTQRCNAGGTTYKNKKQPAAGIMPSVWQTSLLLSRQCQKLCNALCILYFHCSASG